VHWSVHKFLGYHTTSITSPSTTDLCRVAVSSTANTACSLLHPYVGWPWIIVDPFSDVCGGHYSAGLYRPVGASWAAVSPVGNSYEMAAPR
jgi:hypothetical protein